MRYEEDHPAVIAWRQQAECQHCHRDIVNRGGQWIDPRPPIGCEEWGDLCSEIGGDHEPRSRTLAERTYAVRERRGLGHPKGAGRRFRLWCGFLCLFLSAGLVEEAPGAAVIGLLIGAACVLPEMIGGNR